MESLADALIGALRPYFGDASGLLLLREAREAGIRPPLENATAPQRVLLAHRILDNLLGTTISATRMPAVRSRIFSLLNVSEEGPRSLEPESWGWRG